MEYHKQSNCVYHCEYHLVLPTRYRRKIFNEGVFAYFKIKLDEIRKYHPAITIKEVNHDEDHVHLLISISPKMSVGEVVRKIKANTAREIRNKFEFLDKVYWGKEGIWSEGYFVSTVGVDEETIQKYIKMQGKEDSGQTKFEI